ncbi:MAG TPA: hypothetical protein PLF22_08185, partial [Pseudomonadales bacterium]|nr:hypothetical protein [Pseudomonadales bacterium]
MYHCLKNNPSGTFLPSVVFADDNDINQNQVSVNFCGGMLSKSLVNENNTINEEIFFNEKLVIRTEIS